MTQQLLTPSDFCAEDARLHAARDYSILDSWIRRALTPVIPPIADGSTSSVVKEYVRCLDLCREVQQSVSARPPVANADGRWRIAEIGQGTSRTSFTGRLHLEAATPRR